MYTGNEKQPVWHVRDIDKNIPRQKPAMIVLIWCSLRMQTPILSMLTYAQDTKIFTEASTAWQQPSLTYDTINEWRTGEIRNDQEIRNLVYHSLITNLSDSYIQHGKTSGGEQITLEMTKE